MVKPYAWAEPIVGEPIKPRYRVKAISQQREEELDSPILKVVAIGDPHDKPGRCKKRFSWMGRFAAEQRPDAIVSIGDWASLDSLSTHELPGSHNDADRPAFHQDLDSLDESLGTFAVAVGDFPLIHCHGNHEHRAVRSAQRQPKQCGDLPLRLDQTFIRHGFIPHPFGKFVEIGGVDFVHCPLNVMGREVGGQNAERTIANGATKSLVFGHTHRSNLINATKFGQHRKVTVLNLGTSMPYGLVEKYSGLSCTGWSYGVYLLRIRAGEILSAKHYDMLELAETYGD